MKKLHGYLLAGLLAVSAIGGLSSFLFKKDIVVAQAKEVEIDLGLKSSDFIISTGYQIPTSNKWNVELDTTINPYNYENKTFTVPVGAAFQAHISASDNALVNKVSKFHFSLDVNVPGNITGVKLQTYGGKFKNISSVSFSDDTATTYSGDLTVDASDYKGYRFRVERKNVEIVISNFYLNSYETVTTANVSFNMQGHGSQVASQTVDVGSKVTQPTNPSATGYTFGGWYKEASCTNAWNFSTNTVSEDMVLYAKWTLNKYNVSFGVNNTNYGSVSSSSISNVPHGSTISVNGNKVTINGSTVTATAKSQTGYTTTFSSWSNTSGTVTAARTITANFTRTANKYTVTLNADGGTGGSTSVNATYNSAMPSLTIPSKLGYVFQGYYTAQGGSGTKYYNANGSSAKNWDIASAKTLYAYWKYNSDIQNVINKINAIGGPSNVTYPDSKGAIVEAENAYASLIMAHPEYQSIIATEYGTLVSDRETYEALKTTEINNLNTYISNMLDDQDKVNVTYPDSHDDLYGAEGIFNSLDDEDKVETLIPHMDKLTPCREEYNTQRDAAVEATKQAIDEIGETVSYPESKQAIENAESLYNALAPEEQTPSIITNSDWLFSARGQYNSDREDKIDGVQDAIDAIAKPFDANRENQIQNAQDLFDALDESDKNSEVITNLGKLNDAKAADPVATLIEELPDYTDPNEFINAVKAADDAFNALSDKQKEFINQDLLKSLNDYINASGTVELIEAIGDVTYHGGVDDSLEAIVAAENSYNGLSSDQQLIVDAINHDVLLHAREVYDDVKEVVDMINLIGGVVYNPESKEYIYACKEAYDALSDEEKALVYNSDKLFTAYAALEDLIESRDNANAVIALINEIGEVTYPDSLEDIEAARKAYDELDGYEKSLVSNYSVLLEAEEKYENLKNEAMAEAVDALINAIGEVQYPGSKDAIEAARSAYEALTPEQKALVEKLAVLEAAEARYAELKADNEAADAVDALINAIGQVEYTSQSKAKIDAARSAYEALTPAQKALVEKLAVLEAAEARYAELKADNEAADAVDTLINAIGEVKYPSSKEAIEAARNAYQALTPAQKALVDKLAILEAAEARYAQLKADNEAADAVDTLILAIGKVEYTSQSKAKIDAARNAYVALTQEQKALVDNLPILEAAEAAYAKLKADNEAADAVDALIEKIGNVQYPGSKEAIDEARAAYEALTPEQKALVEKLGVLTEAEQTYQNLHQQAETTKTIVIACSIGGGVLLLGGIFLILILVKRRKKKEEEEENKQSK